MMSILYIFVYICIFVVVLFISDKIVKWIRLFPKVLIITSISLGFKTTMMSLENLPNSHHTLYTGPINGSRSPTKPNLN